MTAGLLPIHAGWMVPHVLRTLSGGGSGLLVDAVRFSHSCWLEPAAVLTDRGLAAHSGSGVAVSGTLATDASCLAGPGRVRRPMRVLQFLPIAGGPAVDVPVLLVMMGTGHRYGTRPGVGDLVRDPALDVLPCTASSPHQSAGSVAAPPARSALLFPAGRPPRRPPLRPVWPVWALEHTGWCTATIKTVHRARLRRICPAGSSGAEPR